MQIDSVNTLTAGPLLRLMLAAHGMEPPLIAPGPSWPVFLEFLRVAAPASRDVSSFQASVLREDPETPMLMIRFVRQVSDDAAGWGPLTRASALQFLYELSAVGAAESCEVWSDDFESLDAFIAAVEARAEWRFAVDTAPTDAELVEEDEQDADVTQERK